MATNLRATCARNSWWRDLSTDEYGRSRERELKTYNRTKRARAFWDSKGIDESVVNEVDSCGKTILMHFCAYYHLTKALLERNADPNFACSTGSTALHEISTIEYEYDAYDFETEREDESRKRIRTAEKLIQYGASLSHRNAFGFTPLMHAAHNDRTGLVEYFLTLDSIPRTEKIDALELLGAKHLLYTPGISNYGYYQIQLMDDRWELGFVNLKRAMELRYKNPNDPCLKPCTAQNSLYNNYAESRTMEELLKIKNNRRTQRAEAYLILQRLIPKEMMIKYDPESHESEWDYSTFDVAAVLSQYEEWEEGIDIINFLIGLHVESSQPDARKILEGIKSYLDKVLNGSVRRFRCRVAFGDIHRLILKVVGIVKMTQEPSSSRAHSYEFYQDILDTVAWIVYALICVYPEDEVFQPLIQSLEKFFVSTYTEWAATGHDVSEDSEGGRNSSQGTRKGDVLDGCNISLVHAIITSAVNHPGLMLYPHKLQTMKRVFHRVVMLDCANAVNTLRFDARSMYKENAWPIFHLAIYSWHGPLSSNSPGRGLEILLALIPLVIRHGFSWDQKDFKGYTITGLLSPLRWITDTRRSAHQEASDLLESLKRCDLQELAARVIRSYHIPYRGIIPKLLYEVIEME